MKYKEAFKIMHGFIKKKVKSKDNLENVLEDIWTFANNKKGFMVSFEKSNGSILASDHFPDKHAGEALIKTEKEAWKLAKRFADSTDKDTYVNIYVTDHTFSPVKNYDKFIIRKLR